MNKPRARFSTLRVIVAAAIAFPIAFAVAWLLPFGIDQGDNRWQSPVDEKFAEAIARDDTPTGFRPQPVLARQPPITELNTVRVAEVGERLDDDELVLAVTVDGQSRAYPINGLTGPQREIYNDVLAGQAIAATW